MPSVGTGIVNIPKQEVVGHFDSARPTYNEWIPSQEDSYRMFMRLLPEGRAWTTHDPAIPREESPIRQFWYAVAALWADLELKAVQMVDEAFCQFTEEDLDGWLADYVLPDEAALYSDNICAKVRRIGALTLDEYQAIAESMGWVVLAIQFLKDSHASYPGVYATLYIQASLTSPAIPEEVTLDDIVLDSHRFDGYTEDEATAQLLGLLDRLVPAHNDIIVELA